MSRDELRVVFSREQRREWYWPPEPDSPAVADHYRWGIWMDRGYRPKSLEISVWRDRAAQRSSLAELLRAGRGGLCAGEMFLECDATGFTAAARGNAVELVFRDSAEISRLFGMRPDSVGVFRVRPGGPRHERHKVRVAYLDPQIPLPDSAFIAAQERARQAYVASISRFRRSIDSADRDGIVWVAVGDSVRVEVWETHCRVDLCGMMPLVGTGFAWTVVDTTVARLQPVPPESPWRGLVGPYLHGRRAGRTVVRVTGIHGSSDTISWRQPLPDSLDGEVLVIEVPSRVVIDPRPTIVQIGTPVPFQVQVFGLADQPIPDAPVAVRARHGTYVRLWRRGEPVTFDRPGQWTVTARIGAVADSIVVTVVEPRLPGRSARSRTPRR